MDLKYPGVLRWPKTGQDAINGSYYRSPTFDPEWAARFQQVLDSVMAASGTPGASLAILAPGQGLFTGVNGISTEGVPITTEMRFGIGSNTKLFIAVVLLKLQEQGVLSWMITCINGCHHILSSIHRLLSGSFLPIRAASLTSGTTTFP